MASSESMQRYLQEIGRLPLLTPTEELELGYAIQKMLPFKHTPDKQLSTAERKIKRQGMRAKKRMIEGNLRLVVNVAKRWNFGIHLSLMDLIQEGNVGLDRAVEKYDPARGYKFSTYSYWWIRQSISRSIAYHERAIRLPSSSGDVLRTVQKFIVVYQEQHGKVPSRAECAKHVGVTEESLAHYLSHQQGVASLDTSTRGRNSADQRVSLLDLIADEQMTTDDWLEASLKKDALFAAICTLDKNSEAVLISYYGLYGKPQKNLAVLAKEMGLSRERVRQIKEKAIRKVRLNLSQACA